MEGVVGQTKRMAMKQVLIKIRTRRISPSATSSFRYYAAYPADHCCCGTTVGIKTRKQSTPGAFPKSERGHQRDDKTSRKNIASAQGSGRPSSTVDLSFSFLSGVLAVEPPPHCWELSCRASPALLVPNRGEYYGNGDPKQHLSRFENNALLYRYVDYIKCQVFLNTLEG